MTPKERATQLLALLDCNDRDCLYGHLPAVFCSGCVDVLASAITKAEADVQERCCKVIRAACLVCKGTGLADRDARSDAEECEYCGRPIAAIRNPPAESEVRAALKDAIDNADTPRPGTRQRPRFNSYARTDD